MQIYNTLPKKKDFYSFYAKFGRGIAAGVIALQIISGLTEAAAGYLFMYDSVSFFHKGIGIVAGILGAIAIVLAVEIAGIRFFLPLSVRSILNKKWSGLEAWMTVFAIAGTLCLLGLSGIASWNGARLAVDVFTPEAEQESTVVVDSLHLVNLNALGNSFAADSLTTARRYERLIESEKSAYTAKIEAAKADQRRYEAKQRVTGNSYVSRIEAAKVKAADLEGQRGEKIAALEREKAKELSQLASRKKRTADSLQNVYANGLATIRINNSAAVEEIETAAEKRKTNLAIFAGIACLLLSVVGISMKEIYLHGSGIEEKVEPTEWDYRRGIIFETVQAFGHRFNTWAYGKIDGFNQKTKTASIPQLRPIVYDRSQLYGNNVVELKRAGSEEDNQRRVVFLSNPSLPNAYQNQTGKMQNVAGGDLQRMENQIVDFIQVANDFKQSNLSEKAKAYELKAEEVIRLYLERTGTPAKADQVKAFREKILAYLTGTTAQNPFTEVRRKIGFIITGNNPVSNEPVKRKHFDSRACDHCGKMYEPKAWNQRFCSNKGEGNCKEAWHEKQHGQKFNPKRYHRSKKRK